MMPQVPQIARPVWGHTLIVKGEFVEVCAPDMGSNSARPPPGFRDVRRAVRAEWGATRRVRRFLQGFAPARHRASVVPFECKVRKVHIARGRWALTPPVH